MSLRDRLTAPGPKRILTLDGGGIRGNISIGLLERLEQVLRQQTGNDTLRLCDYFDLIAGTSTGSLIATMLGGMGFDMAETKRVYLTLAARAFSDKRSALEQGLGLGKAEYHVEPLEDLLTELFGNRTLGDPDIPTGLCLVTKRADTGSTWPLINHPDGKYFDANKDIELRLAVRAAGAAPTIFDPAEVEWLPGKRGAFIDGAISTANNPAFQTFLVATLGGFPFRWATGADQLLLVSIGTGTWHRNEKTDKMLDYWGKDWASAIPDQLIEDTNWQNQTILQYLSKTATPWLIDSEIGDLGGDVLGGQPALTYLRYNAWLEADALESLGLEALIDDLGSLRKMDIGDNAEKLLHIGTTAATAEPAQEPDDHRRFPILGKHFPAAFDV